MPKDKKGKKQKQEDRFAAAETRPQFRKVAADDQKVVLDERFQSILTDERFQVVAAKDKYGRSNKKKTDNVTEDLGAFYTIGEKEDEENNKSKQDKPKKVDHDDGDDDKDEPATEVRENENEEQSDKDEDPASRIAYLTALSRGELDMSSSSDDDESSQSSDEDDPDEDQGEDPVYGKAGVLDPSTHQDAEVELSYDDSPYLVATNLDWENLRAVDIFSILASFSPPGAVKRVQVYQSDFGMERMERDKLHGPSDIWKRKQVKHDPGNESDDDASSVGSQDKDDSDGVEAENQDGDEATAESIIKDEDEEQLLNRDEDVLYDESDFDPEKLRAYEASKLKYFFAIVEFAKSEYADVAYREVDGIEFEHSSSAIDLRTLPPEELEGVVEGRPLRDEATSIPSNYEPPDFVVSALQQTNVRCTWDQGDVEREKKLTKYTSGEWQGLSEADDLQAYLASDASSDEESDDEKAAKGSKLRKLLGLDSDNEDEGNESGAGSNSDSSDNEDGGKTLKFVPGTKNLEEKIRAKLDSKDEPEELTPWQKYQEKRKQKRKDRKEAAKNRKANDGGKTSSKKAVRADESSEDEDDFFLEDAGKAKSKRKPVREPQQSYHSSNHELELLLAGENEEEEARDYDIRGIQRMEKNKNKKLRGTRKRKEEKISADVSGKDFKVNVEDDRFAAVLEGSDDRFGIDKTDPNFKDTPAMQQILSEQTKRRKKKQKKSSGEVAPNVDVDQNGKSAGASALSALVQKLKTQVA